MAKPFDATLNALIDARPDDWANGFGRLVGIPPGPCEVLDTDLATTVQADKVFRINGPQPAILHLELEANPRLGVPHDLLRYNTLIDHQHGLPVETVLVLLRPKALASDQTGRYDRVGVGGRPITTFHYHVERVWERPTDYWLTAGLGLAPLALLTNEASRDLDGTLDRFRDKLRADSVAEPLTSAVLSSSYFLCGLRFDPDEVQRIFRRFNMLMEESTTYQHTIQLGRTQGRVEEARNLLLRQGTKRFGQPAPAVTARLDGITDIARLESLADRILDATDWDDLFKTV
jgi:hypothetical protein